MLVEVVVVVVTGFSATGSNVEVMELLSSETSILIEGGGEALLALAEDMRSSTSSGSSGCSVGWTVVVLRSTMLSGTVLSATAASSVLVSTAGFSELVGAFHR